MSCAFGGAAIGPWSRWIGLALAGSGVAVAIWRRLKRPREELLQSPGIRVLRSDGATARPSAEIKTGLQIPLPRRPGPPAPGGGTFSGVRVPSPQAASKPEYSFDSWRFRAHGAKAPEPVCIPQNSIRFAADSGAKSVHEKASPGVDSREVIDQLSIREDYEKRYRTKRAAPAAKTSGQPPRSSLAQDIEEVRRRLGKADRERLTGAGRELRGDKDTRREKAQPRSACGSDAGAFPKGLLIPAWSTVAEKQTSPDEPRGMGPKSPPEIVEAPAGSAWSKVHQTSGQIPSPPGLSDKARRDAAPAVFPVPSLYEPEAGRSIHRLSQEPPAPGAPEGMPECKTDAPAATGCARDPFGSIFCRDFCLPSVSLLHPADSAVAPVSQDDLLNGGILIEEKLAEFRVKVNVQDAYAGPVITRYEVQPAVGVRGGQVVSLMKDLARALGVASIRVVETIPGKTCMGLELPNVSRQMIRLSEVISSELFCSHGSKLAMALGKDITGEPVVADLARAPHMLVAGTTGSGKSVGLNGMILSLLYRATPAEVRFVMIDPKMLELSIYDGIPHLLAPVVTDMKLAANALNWCVCEMDRRYRLLNSLHVRNVAGYNQRVKEARPPGLSPLPYIVVVVDELADLMMTTGKKIEELIARLAQKARAAGIHLIVATQRPSVDVITGLIKANIPTRIAFQVSSRIDSRTILDQMGAECLLGQGDMLYLPPGSGYPLRVHGAFVADEEVQAVAEHLKRSGEPDYLEEVLGGPAEAGDEATSDGDRLADEADPLYDEAVAFVFSSHRASISAVQRHLRIGYNRAARIIEQMEACGIVSPMESNGNRTLLASTRQE